jgi:ferredoxin
MIEKDAYEVLCAQLEFPGSKRLRAMLEEIMTPRQAKVAAALPGTPEEVAQKLGMDLANVKADLDALFEAGTVFPRNFDKKDYYRFARHMPQLHDATKSASKRIKNKDTKFFKLWDDFATNEMYAWYAGYRQREGKAYSRVVPAYKALEGVSGVLPCEDYRELIKAQELIAIVPCPCRMGMTFVDRHCSVTKEEKRANCFQFGRGAEYAIKRGTGVKLSTKEALDLLDKIEEDGLIHKWANKAEAYGVAVACQCCRDCCFPYAALDQAKISIGTAWEKSRYEAYVDTEKCTGCQTCVDRCQFDAIEMQKVPGSKKMKALVDGEKCFGCGVCVVGCDKGGMKIKAVRPPEHIPGAVESKS